jgi:uncharacterized membrane protein HdeD (DUF308 family)
MTNTSNYDRSEPMQASGYPWWALLIQGIVAIVLGVMLMAQPGATTVVVVYFFGWVWLISGIVTLASLFWEREGMGWKIVSGVVGIIAGLYVIGSPVVGAIIAVGAATLVIGVLGVIIGVSDLTRAFQGAGWGLGVLGALSLIIGVSILFDLPRYALALPWVWGLLALIGGVAAFVHSFMLRREQHEHGMPSQMHPVR